MKNKKLLFFLIVIGIVIFILVLILTGGIRLSTFGQDNQTKNVVYTEDDLEENCYYVWHDTQMDDHTDTNVFQLCPAGSTNWDKDTSILHTIWFTTDCDKEIPTLYPGDKLLYVSSTSIPFEGIEWERFADYGYTIGVANMIGDESGHYRISNSNGKGFKGYVCPESDANQLNESFMEISYLFLDKVGGIKIRQDGVSEGGTICNLVKDKAYVCEWYTGTIYQDFKMTANVHSFSLLEKFVTYDYEFLHSNCIEISIPDWFKTGYYYVEGTGMFRYVSESDKSLYSGKEYDKNINWNDPIILYDDHDNLIYNPSTGVDKRSESEYINGERNVGSYGDDGISESNDSNSGLTSEQEWGDESGDVGADYYEDFENDEIIYNDEDVME